MKIGVEMRRKIKRKPKTKMRKTRMMIWGLDLFGAGNWRVRIMVEMRRKTRTKVRKTRMMIWGLDLF